MQITINEAEIHIAIRNHVLGMIAVREDMKIDIDLKATRGAEGFTAVIDILPENSPVAAPKAAEQAKTVSVKTAEPKAETKAAEPKAAPKVEATPAAKPKGIFAAKVTQELPETTGEELVAETAEEPAVEAEVVATERPRSIFAGMTKPVNAKADAEVA